jgi:hypothetical protein
VSITVRKGKKYFIGFLFYFYPDYNIHAVMLSSIIVYVRLCLHCLLDELCVNKSIFLLTSTFNMLQVYQLYQEF